AEARRIALACPVQAPAHRRGHRSLRRSEPDQVRRVAGGVGRPLSPFLGLPPFEVTLSPVVALDNRAATTAAVSGSALQRLSASMRPPARAPRSTAASFAAERTGTRAGPKRQGSARKREGPPSTRTGFASVPPHRGATRPHRA